MQGICTVLVPAKVCDKCTTHISPCTLIDGFMERHVFSFLFAIEGPIGRKTDSLVTSIDRGIDGPAVIPPTYIDPFPELQVFDLVPHPLR